MFLRLLIAWALCLLPTAGATLRLVRPASFLGMCDASCAVAVSSNLFLVGNDEDNVLRLYAADRPGLPVKEFDMTAFLEVRAKSPEADLEGAVRIGNRAFWIGSHGANRAGKYRPNRGRFFATDIQLDGTNVLVTPAGRPCRRLLEDLVAEPALQVFGLAAAAMRTPKEPGALNIEGLAATPEGHLLIGFRNPVPQGKALLVPLLNPDQVIQGEQAHFGPSLQLDLGGFGIRDMANCGNTYVILAGPYDSGRHFLLYQWAGPGTAPDPLVILGINSYHPEALILYPQNGLNEWQILSDDGNRVIDGCRCKDLTDPRRKAFSGFWITP